MTRACKVMIMQKTGRLISSKLGLKNAFSSSLIFLALLSGVSRFGFYSVGSTDLVVRFASAALSILTVWLLWSGNRSGRNQYTGLALYILFATCGLLCLNLVFALDRSIFVCAVVILPIVILLLCYMSQRCSLSALKKPVVEVVVFYACLLIAIAFLEQLRLVHFPGQSFAYSNAGDYMIRPASLTGSYLHLPIVLFLMGCFLVASRKEFDWVTAFVLGYPLTIGSRSALVMAVAFVLTAFLFRKRLQVRWVIDYRLLGIGLLLVLSHMLAILVYSHTWESGPAIVNGVAASADRSINALALTAPGNGGRVSAWVEAFSRYVSWNHLFVGELGCCGNFASKLQQVQQPVYESSLFVLIGNFGVLFALLVYILIFFEAKVTANPIWTLAVVCFLGHSLIYQSLEVYSLLFLVAFFSSVLQPVQKKCT